MHVLSHSEVEELLDLDALLDALAAAHAELSAGKASLVPRVGAFAGDAGVLGAMPGYAPSAGLGCKLVTLFPGNRDRPTHQALIALFERYGLAVPPNPWAGKVPRYASVREACEAGIRGEIENSALYERLKAATSRPDILTVFKMLEAASREHHLPAFRRCAERSGAPPGYAHRRP